MELKKTTKPRIVNVLTPAFKNSRLSARQYQPFVSVVLTVAEHSPATLDVIRTALNLNYHSFELLVVDQTSTGSLKLIMQPHLARQDAYYYRCSNANVLEARNYAAQFTRASLIAFLDASTPFDANWLAEKVTVMQRNPDATLLCQRRKMQRSRSTTPLRGRMRQHFVKNYGVIDVMLVRRVAFAELNGFADSDDVNVGSRDLAVRAMKKGYEVVEIAPPGARQKSDFRPKSAIVPAT